MVLRGHGGGEMKIAECLAGFVAGLAVGCVSYTVGLAVLGNLGSHPTQRAATEPAEEPVYSVRIVGMHRPGDA
jgi:hypothetical protein